VDQLQDNLYQVPTTLQEEVAVHLQIAADVDLVDQEVEVQEETI
jgi:hypothetical protein